MKLKFLVAFFLIGLIISMICGIIAGNKITYIILVSLISAATFGAFGFGIFTMLERKVPEVVEFLEGVELDFQSGSDDFEGGGASYEGSSQFATESVSSSYAFGGSTSESTPKNKRQQQGNIEGYISVDNITIKNEPKLMAEAVRTMLAKDEMEGTSKSVQEQITKGK